MATLQTHLQFGDNGSGIYNKDYLVVECHTNISRYFNSFHPVDAPRCECISVTVVAPGKRDLELFGWFKNNASLSGRIQDILVDVAETSDTIDRSIKFENARCLSFKETYDIAKKSQRLLTITFLPEEVKVDGASFTRNQNAQKKSNPLDNEMDMATYNKEYDF